MNAKTSSEGPRLAESARAVRGSTMERLRAVPEGRENWRLSPNAMSFADLAAHLIDTDHWLFQKLEDPTLAPILGQAHTTHITDRAAYDTLLTTLEALGERRATLLESLSDDALATLLHDARFGGEVPIWWIIVRGNLDH